MATDNDEATTRGYHGQFVGLTTDWPQPYPTLNGRNSMRQVAGRLGMDPRTLRRLMNETPKHINKPWVDIGTEAKPSFRWCEEGIERWLREMTEWRASQSLSRASTRSDGETLTARRAREPARTSGRRKPSSSRSNEHSPSGGGGRLQMLVRHLGSK